MNAIPQITGPIHGGKFGWPFAGYFGDISQKGYVEEEYFIEGVAPRYRVVGEQGRDGKWTLEEREPSAYKTRFVVHRPTDPAKFNGTVIVEWGNVSSGYEMVLADGLELYDAGFVFVLATVQPAAITGFVNKPQGLLAWDPERYGSLHIESDGASYGIFTQIARAVGRERTAAGPDPLAGLEVKHLIGIGGSQSGGRVQTYLNGVQPMEQLFDAMLPFLNAGSVCDFTDVPGHHDRSVPTDKPRPPIFSLVRDDISIPTIVLNSQTECSPYTFFSQPDTELLHVWEIPGAAHIGGKLSLMLRRKTDRDGLTNSLEVYRPFPISDMLWQPSLSAALLQLNRYLNGTGALRTYPRIQRSSGANYAVDEHENVKGGIRLPELEVPTASYPPVSLRMGLGGAMLHFSAEKLKALYPTHEDYVQKVAAAVQAALEADVITPQRADEYLRMAQAAPVPELRLPDFEAR